MRIRDILSGAAVVGACLLVMQASIASAFTITMPGHLTAVNQVKIEVVDTVTGAANDAYDWTNENVFRPVGEAFQDAQCYAVERAAREHNIRFWPDSGCDRAFDEGGGTAWWLG